MNDDKLECLRLAIEWVKVNPNADALTSAKVFYDWVSTPDKPNKLHFEKISKERE